jgi:hypothetical protein
VSISLLSTLECGVPEVALVAVECFVGNKPFERRNNKMHNLVVSCLVVAYLSANVYAMVKLRVFELPRSRKHLLLYGVPFILWGSLILLGRKLMEIMRRFDEWAA